MAPTQPVPQGNYVPANRDNNLIHTAGMTPRHQGKLIMTGRVSTARPLNDYREAVELAATNAITAAKGLLQSNEQLKQVIAMTVYVAAEEGFTAHSKLADFASNLLAAELGEAGISSRAAVGVYSLPGNAPVEISILASVQAV